MLPCPTMRIDRGFKLDLKAVIFDLDNTLVDRDASLRRFGHVLIDKFGLDADRMSSDEVCNLITDADGGGYRPKVDFFNDLSEKIPWHNTPSVPALTALYAELFPQCTEPMPGLIETLDRLRNDKYLIGLITNGSTIMQTGKIERLSLQSLLDHITISESAGVRKPDKKIFIQTLEAMALTPEQAWYVGDHPLNDVVGASRAGMTAIWFRRNEAWQNTSPAPDHTITRLEALIPLLPQSRLSG